MMGGTAPDYSLWWSQPCLHPQLYKLKGSQHRRVPTVRSASLLLSSAVFVYASGMAEWCPPLQVRLTSEGECIRQTTEEQVLLGEQHNFISTKANGTAPAALGTVTQHLPKPLGSHVRESNDLHKVKCLAIGAYRRCPGCQA